MNESSSKTQSTSILRCAVVGVEGSVESMDALNWAARAVGGDGAVHAVHAVEAGADLPAAARRLEREWTSPIRSGNRIDGRVRAGRPADVPIDTARELRAEAIVVGVHAKPRHLPRTIGRVTAELLRNVDRPLVVVGLLEVMAFSIDPDVLALWAAEDLDELVEEIQRGTDHDLRIKWSSEVGRRVPPVVEAAKSATLIVIGRNSRPGESRVVPHDLRQVITRAPCPVVVVPPQDEESPRAR